MDRSFTLGSTEEANNVKILQSCNGLLLCGGSGMPVFDYVYKSIPNRIKSFRSFGLLAYDFGSSEFTIYEMTIGCSVWMVRYRVYTDDFMTPIPEVFKWVSDKVVEYNLISKTLHEIYDYGSNQLDDNHDDDDDELLQQFQAEHNIYEFIPSFASV
ncbi:hypothetical protein Tco_0703756 [Tanacetum coccineum]|uniref:Uncharacterized protein n=1 Tax=Tanacetum coccineum TaxID=301880 RepID=A0ABQ4Y1H9_9ASTR